MGTEDGEAERNVEMVETATSYINSAKTLSSDKSKLKTVHPDVPKSPTFKKTTLEKVRKVSKFEKITSKPSEKTRDNSLQDITGEWNKRSEDNQKTITQKSPVVLKKTLSSTGKKLRMVNRMKGEGVDSPLPIPDQDEPITQVLERLADSAADDRMVVHNNLTEENQKDIVKNRITIGRNSKDSVQDRICKDTIKKDTVQNSINKGSIKKDEDVTVPKDITKVDNKEIMLDGRNGSKINDKLPGKRKKKDFVTETNSIKDSMLNMSDSPMKNSSSTTVRVGKVTPSVQCEIDKRSYRDLDQDFPQYPPIKRKKLGGFEQSSPPRQPAIRVESDSDFESPNLLDRRRHLGRPKMVGGGGGKELVVEKSVEDKKKVDKADDIEIVASPDGTEEDKDRGETKKDRPMKAIKKAENRWGMEIDDVTKSQKKRLKNQKQSKLDGFFKNPPPAKSVSDLDNFKRISHVDTDLERALQLSKDTLEQNSNSKITEEATDELDDPRVRGDVPDEPGYAYINAPVRGKEARKKLHGFDCRECQEYYQMKLEEGLNKDQIMMLMNKCSRHRGKFKPPVTPDKYWDPDIVEEPNDPREQTQHGQPLRSSK